MRRQVRSASPPRKRYSDAKHYAEERYREHYNGYHKKGRHGNR